MLISVPPEHQLPRTALGMALSYMLSSAVHVATALGIADLLSSGPKTALELAQATGTHASSLERMMRALVASGLFVLEDSRFALNDVAEPLRSDVPNSVRHYVLNAHVPWQVRSWQEMLTSIRTGAPAFDHLMGKPVFKYLDENPEESRRFDAVMQTHTLATVQPLMAACTFEAGSRILDIGGGDGTFLQALLRVNPACRGTTFDAPRVIEAARQRPVEPDIADRFELVSGDFFESVPAGYQVHLLKHVLHDWDDERAVKILHNCSRALPSGGRVLIVEMVMQPNERRPFAAMVDVGIMLISGGRERTEQEFSELCREAGGLLPQEMLPGDGPVRVFVAARE